MKVECPVCGEEFELDTNEFDEGDAMECPQCGAELTVMKKNAKYFVEQADSEEYDEKETSSDDEESYEESGTSNSEFE